MQIFDEEETSLKPRKEEVCKDFYKTRKTKNNEWLKKLLSKKPLTPWTMVFPDPPPQSCPWGSANSLLFLTLYTIKSYLSLPWLTSSPAGGISLHHGFSWLSRHKNCPHFLSLFTGPGLVTRYFYHFYWPEHFWDRPLFNLCHIS